MRVLIVDNEIEIGKLLQRELEREGCEAEYAASAVDLPARLSEREGDPCELLLLNLDMPEVNGLQLLEEIKDIRPDLDVIVITADGDEDKAIEAIHLGAIDYLRKPISMKELRTALFRVRQKQAAKAGKALKHRVLVVDDEKDLAARIKQELEREGHEVAMAYDGIAGLDYFKNNHVDAVIADIRMPGIDGLEMLDQCRGINSDFVSIVITGFGDHERAIKSLRLGVFDYLSKPIALEELVSVVGKALDLVVLRRGLSARQRELEIESALKTRYAEKLEREKEALRKSEEKYRTILENMEEGYYEIDIAGYFRFFNDSLCQILGYPRDELMRMNNRQNTDEENSRKVYQTYDAVYRSGKTVNAFDWEIITKEGAKRYVEASISRISGPQGQPTGFRGILRDITERKQMQREIAERQEYQAAVLRNAPDAIVTFDGDGHIIEWNPEAERLFGYAYDEVVGRDVDDVVTRPDVEEQARFFTKLLLSEKNLPPTEVVRYRKDGTPINVIVTGSPTIIGLEFRGAVVIYTDLTERKRMEEALKESEEKYRSLVRNVKLGIFRSTPDPMGRFLEVNPAMEEITGYSREELLRMNVVDLYVHPRERATILELAVVRGKIAKEILFKKKGGAEITVWETKVAVKDDTGVVAHFDGILEDITERKILERELQELYATEQRERQELEKEARARGQFINVLAHELRTPLTPVMISSGMLRDALSSSPESIQFKLTNNILNGTQAMASRLDELLDLARFSAGTFILYRQALDIRRFLEKTASEFQPAIEHKGQYLIKDLPPILPIIQADPSRLQQVLLNLLSNASKFSPEGRAITIRARTEGNELVIEVEDQGIGISPEEQQSLFRPYHQVEPDRQALPGLGLGLAIARQIIEAHGGRMWLTSELGQGSTFSFSIPVWSS